MPVKADTNSNDFPPSRKGTATAKHKTHLPGSKVPFNRFIYIFSALVVAFTLFNVYRILQWKTLAGGWTSLMLGKLGENPSTSNNDQSAQPSSATDHPRESVDYHIEALAKALGLPSRDLASAIAEAIREHIPPASLSSVSAAEATQSGDPVNIIVGKGADGADSGSSLKERLGMLSSFDDPELGGLD
ncbi:hypothetical protein Clacol_008389 [Clathrus columnatus]|uniref:Uncharacterized protein n=1 Tax=Clathrus columnatus TaxID=1419009 RepID=A0AAV5AHL1_9AGAM|nr:hypothetical protein Clacol_008389 [Clathrus columnatus]